MFYFSYHIGDFVSATCHLDLREEAIYRRLLDLYYQTETPLEDDVKALSRSIRAKGEEEVVKAILEEFFKLSDGVWRQTRVDEEIEKFREKSRKASESASHRWKAPIDTGSKSERKANAKRTHNETDPNGMLTKNQEPITNNQEPEKRKRESSAPSRSLPLTVIDPLWSPSAELITEVAEIATVSEKFARDCSIGFGAHYVGRSYKPTALRSALVKWVDRERRFRE